MRFNPDIYHRRSIRLKSHDYSGNGYYFVTLCTYNRELYFLLFPELREIVDVEWRRIPHRYDNVRLDEFVIMPNHIHGIIIVGATLAVARKERCGTGVNRAGTSPAPTTLGGIIGSFKSLCNHSWLNLIKKFCINAPGKIWQRNYYDHIIRNETELNGIRQYIRCNPVSWPEDDYYQP